MSPVSHPYQQGASGAGLQVPSTGLANGFVLSPITEGSNAANGGEPSTPSASSGYSVGRGPFSRPSPIQPTPMSLVELKRLCVKFILPDDHQSTVVNVGDCEGGVEVVERVLRKMGKMQNGPLFTSETDIGGLIIGGWAVYLETPGRDRMSSISASDFSFLILIIFS